MVARDSANGGVLNPHEDEGRDNGVDRRTAPALVAGFAADPSIVAAVGGLRRSVGDADAAAADAHGLPAMVLARWSRGGPRANAFCLCASPPRLVAFAPGRARARFGPRLLVVLVGEAAALPRLWPGRLAPRRSSRSATRRPPPPRRASAPARPTRCWCWPTSGRRRSGARRAFRRGFDREYVRGLGQRGFELVPAGTRGASWSSSARSVPQARSSARSRGCSTPAAGFLPDEAATRGYAAAQILGRAGPAGRRYEARWPGAASPPPPER